MSSNTESLSYSGGGNSGQWSQHAGVDSSWSSFIEMPSVLSSFTCNDHHFTLNQTQSDFHHFHSLPDNIATGSCNVQYDQVEPSGLSLGSQAIGHNAQNLLLPSNQTLAAATDDMAWYGEKSAVQWNQLSASTSPPVAPIPAFVSNASYDGMFYVADDLFIVCIAAQSKNCLISFSLSCMRVRVTSSDTDLGTGSVAYW